LDSLYITFPLTASSQELCAGIGMFTFYGLAGKIENDDSKPILTECVNNVKISPNCVTVAGI